MRLNDLHPVIGGSGEFNELSFDCPLCGPPYRIWILMKLGGPAKDGIWKWTFDADGNVSIDPSINNHNHGRKKTCNFHCTITKGEVLP